jgi:trehalose/maltose hydrolase-like predicted phosphorylase
MHAARPDPVVRVARLLGTLACLSALSGTRVVAQQAAGATRDSTFLLVTSDPARSPSPFLGNGHFSVVIPASGLGPSLSLVAGIDEHVPGDVARIAALPAWNSIAIRDGGTGLDAASPPSALRSYRQVLDMRTGTAHTSYDWVNGSHRISVRVETFISRADPHLAGVRLDIVPRYAGRVRMQFAIAGRPPPHRLALGRLERTEPDWGPEDLWYPGRMIVRSRDALLEEGGARLRMTSSPEGNSTTVAEVATVSWPRTLQRASTRTTGRGDTTMVELEFDAAPGRSYAFSQLVHVVSSTEAADPLAVATRQAVRGRSRGYAALSDANARAWRERWETDIEIDGDPHLQRLVRSMLFYLLCSADSGTALGIPPMGLSSGGYYGHIFWDSDTWMFPPLLVTHPDIARSLVAFRARALGAALENARANGFRGAMYPWESDYRGHEATPRFASQNASSEIHVTGDVALAQWQYYLATGDSAWLAREGFPVIRATADFWVSRATHDSTDNRSHIENVVSVAEGLIGVTDDAYTNAVARKNLRIAEAASEKLGKEPDPRWEQLASTLAMPYDSVSGYFRTYAGAPDSTLGDVTPLLAYPLGVPMTEQAKRAQLEQAIRQLLEEGQGAMMGSTLLSVDAAELGDSALVDSLLPHSYREHLMGPFLMLSETPRNAAVYFATGAGGFLQQVIFGYPGLRLGERGMEEAFPPVLPSRIERLVLRGLHVRGKRYDVVVDSTGRRVLPHADARGMGAGRRDPGSDAGRHVAPVLDFPEPGMDDTAAYQGYKTRFYRDSKGNALQVYLDGRSGRVVNMWADAADESIGFTARDGEGRPAALRWGSDSAIVADSGAVRTLTYTLTAPEPRLDIGLLLLGSMRVERDFQYARQHLEPFGSPAFRERELVQLIENLRKLAPAEQRRELALLNATSIAQLSSRLTPTLTSRCDGSGCVVRAVHTSFDGVHHLALELRTDPRAVSTRIAGRTVTIQARPGAPVRVAVTVATDAAALTPLGRDEIFSADFLRFLASARAAHDSALRAADAGKPGRADSTTIARYRWLEREVRSVELLSTEEKLMAGMPNYATYFGRDMMMSSLMMQPIWREEMGEHVIASVLRKLSPRGDVSHEEALGGQAIREHASVYNTLIADSLPIARRRSRAAADSVLARARTELRDIRVVRENYHMMDDEFQLAVVAARYLDDPDVPADRKRAFLLAAGSSDSTSRLALLLRELSLVTLETGPYARDPVVQNLIAFPKLDSTHWRSASWRDSQTGYANGRFAMDINAIWAPEALESIARIVDVLHTLDFTAAALDSLAPEAARTPLGSYIHDPARARRDANVWRSAERHFIVTLAPSEVRRGIQAKLAWLPPEERRYWERLLERHGGVRDSLSFLAVSLDSAGHPIPVVNTDPATGLFLGDLTAKVLADTLSAAKAIEQIGVFTRSYPVALFVEGLGPLVANDAYASPGVWSAFRDDPYHGPRVVWGREVNLLLLALSKQLAPLRADSVLATSPAVARYARALEAALRKVDDAVLASGFKHAELWSYQIRNGRLIPTRYGTSSDIQLWSSTDLAVQYVMSKMERD